jgi:hypothetical protein
VPGWIRQYIRADAVGSLAQIRRDGPYCAALARIRYADDSARESWLLLLKASLAPDIPVDVRSYAAAHTSFPQESTSDQFFDDGQWESYRRLGQAVGGAVFLQPPDRANRRTRSTT